MIQNQASLADTLDEHILNNVPSPGTAAIIVSEWYTQARCGAVIKACRDMLHLYPDDIRLRRLACLAYSALDFDREALEETDKKNQPLTEFSTGAGYKALLEQWRSKCRTLFDTTVLPDNQGGIP
jgi:hypothetical protein